MQWWKSKPLTVQTIPVKLEPIIELDRREEFRDRRKDFRDAKQKTLHEENKIFHTNLFFAVGKLKKRMDKFDIKEHFQRREMRQEETRKLTMLPFEEKKGSSSSSSSESIHTSESSNSDDHQSKSQLSFDQFKLYGKSQLQE